jgi:hypothetical protein
MLLMSVRLYNLRPHSLSRDLTMALAALPPFTTDTKIQFWYVCSQGTRAHTEAKMQHTAVGSLL